VTSQQDDPNVSIERLSGQLQYLLEERPELRGGSIAALVERLNHEDRFARARERYPQASDAEVAERVTTEFEPRITAEQVQAARALLR